MCVAPENYYFRMEFCKRNKQSESHIKKLSNDAKKIGFTWVIRWGQSISVYFGTLCKGKRTFTTKDEPVLDIFRWIWVASYHMRNLKLGYQSRFWEIGQLFTEKLGFKTVEFSKSTISSNTLSVAAQTTKFTLPPMNDEHVQGPRTR
jgi:hypothetical protein